MLQLCSICYKFAHICANVNNQCLMYSLMFNIDNQNNNKLLIVYCLLPP